MKKILFIIIVLGFSGNIFSQGTLYVNTSRPTFDVNTTGDCRIGDYRYRYNISHLTGQYDITSSSVDVSISFQEGYNDDPGYGCNGPCGQFSWANPIESNSTLNYYYTLLEEYSGPEIVTCAWDYLINQDLSAIPISYYAVFMPDLVLLPDGNVCSPLFESYNGQTPNFASVGMQWEYDSGNGFEPLPNFANTFPLDKSIEEIFGSDYKTLIPGDNFQLRYSVFQGDYYSDTIVVDIVECSPNLVGIPQTTNETCYSNNDGSVTLTFDGNVDVGNNYEMRYFIYQGDPSSFSGNPEDEFPPQAYEDYRLGALSDNGNGTFSGSSNTNLEAGTYFIVFQEVLYNGLNVTVKSGEITPSSFMIGQPSQIMASGTITQAQCNGDNAQLGFTATGGDDLNPGGSYSYQYRFNAADPWLTATANPQPITPIATPQTVFVKAIYSVGNCESTEVTLTDQIDPALPELVITNTSFVAPSSGSSTDGSIRVQINGGTPSYTYVLSKLNTGTGLFDTNETISNSNVTTVDFFGKSVGTYRITVTDNNACTIISGDIVVTALPPPTLGAEQTNQISCVGGSDGSIDVDVLGGVLNYNYQWTINGVISAIQTTGSQTISLSNLSEPGEYIIKVSSNAFTDFNDASGYVTTTINLIPPEEVIIISAIPNDIGCNGAQDGGMVVTASGGTSYQYKLGFFGAWTALDSNTIPITSEGFYDVYLRNQNGCESAPITGIFVAEPEVLEVTGTPTDATTNGGSEGTITLTVTGGTTPYTNYAWLKDGQPFTPSIGSTDTYLINVEAGTYQVVVTDTNTCMATSANINVTEPGPLGITSLTSTPVLCRGEATGSITAVVTGIAPFNYIWERQDGQPITSPNTPTINNLAEGIYILRLTDASGDPEVTDTVTITEPLEALDATAAPTAATCFGGNDGSIQITALGGTAPYEYEIDDGFGFQASDTFTNLAPRTYAVTVRDANNCVFNTTTIVDQPIEITVTIVNLINASVSGGTDGAIFITVNGGTAPFTFSWTGPNGYVNNIEDIAGLEVGSYTLVIRDANNGGFIDGCYFTQTFEITEPGPLSINNILPTDVSCFGEASGSIITTVIGEGAIVYEWTFADGSPVLMSNGTDGPNITGISAGSYMLTVTDDNTTTSSAPIIINQPTEALNITNVITTDVSCFEGFDGSIQIEAQGGTGPYTYSLDGVNYQNPAIFNGLAQGSITAYVRDGNNCDFIYPIPVVINEPQVLSFVIDAQQPLSAAGAEDGAISITAFGGTGNLTYSWAGPPGSYDPASPTISNLPGGDYVITITDENYNPINPNACSFVSETITIAEPGELTASIAQTVLLECNGDNFAEITANVQGGVTPYTFEWFQIENGSNTALNEDTEILGNLSAGEYFLRVTDANTITVEATSVIIAQPDLLEIIVDSFTNVLCANDETGAINISVTGGTPPYQYFWDNGETNEDIANIPAGEYTIEIVDANGCLAQESITISAPPNALQITNSTITNVSAYQANDGSITLEISGGLEPYSIDWIRLSDTANVGNQNSISSLAADSYEVTVSDANGCTITETYLVTQPDVVEETIIQPSCSGFSDGSIAVLVNQGNGAFTYSWDTGETTNNITDLPPGVYTITITGFGDGPLIRTYTLVDPLPLAVDLGEDKTLCTDQELVLDATVGDETATYRWTSDNGFSSAEAMITVSTTGTYSVTVQTVTGCTTIGAVAIDVSTDEISAEFAVSSQVFVGETVVAVDISYPLPESMEWVLPEDAEILKQDSDEVELVFAEPGNYEIGIVTQLGNCTAVQTKSVLVVAKDGTIDEDDAENQQQLIEDFIVYPNPSDGRFTADIKLTERGNISIKVFNLANNALMSSVKDRGETAYSIPFDISGLPSGVYAVLLETPYGNSLRKVIVR